MNETDEAAAIEKVVSDLEHRFPHVPRPVIAGIVHQRYATFSGARVRDYIPVMVRREAAEELRAIIRESKASHPSIVTTKRSHAH